jgi:hypothetical protein
VESSLPRLSGSIPSRNSDDRLRPISSGLRRSDRE